MKNSKLQKSIKWFLLINIFITLMSKARMLQIFFSWHSDVLTYVVVAVFFVSGLVGLIGLALNKLLGFVSLYVLVSVSTYYLAIALSPLILVFPNAQRVLPLLGINAIMLAGAIWLHFNRSNRSNIRQEKTQ